MTLHEYLKQEENKTGDLYIGTTSGGGYFFIGTAQEAKKHIPEIEKKLRGISQQNLHKLQLAADREERKFDEKICKLKDAKVVPATRNKVEHARRSIELLAEDVLKIARKYTYNSAKKIFAERIVNKDAVSIMKLQVKETYTIKSPLKIGTGVILEPQEWEFPSAMLYWDKNEMLGIDKQK